MGPAGRRALMGLSIAGGLVVGACLVAYLADAPVAATVRSTRCDVSGGVVHVETKALHWDHTVRDVPFSTCVALHPGNYVSYHIRTGRTLLYAAEGGECVWDTATGPC